MTRASVTVSRFGDVAEYARRVEPFLLRREAENCFFLGQLTQLKGPADALLLAAVDSGGEPLAVATMTPGRHMVMTAAPPAAVDALADHLLADRVDLPGIAGPPGAAEPFAQRWCAATGATFHRRVRMATHQLTAVTPPPPAPGAMRFAGPADVERVAAWVQAFREAIGEGHLGGARQAAERRVLDGELALWEDGEPVAMAGATGPTRNGIRIVLVYTPPPRRGRGYASNLVAALSQHHLAAGRRSCFLNTDLANPTPNKIYHRIGYRPVSESVTLMFDPSPARR